MLTAKSLHSILKRELTKKGWAVECDGVFYKKITEGTVTPEDLHDIAKEDPSRLAIILRAHGCHNIDELHEKISMDREHERERMIFEVKMIKDKVHGTFDGVLIDAEERKVEGLVIFVMAFYLDTKKLKRKRAA